MSPTPPPATDPGGHTTPHVTRRPRPTPVSYTNQLLAVLTARRPELAHTPGVLDDVVNAAAQVMTSRLAATLSTTQVRPGDVDDCGFLTEPALRAITDLVRTSRSPAPPAGDDTAAAGPGTRWDTQPRSVTGLTLSTIISALSGLHFAKETLTDGEHELLTLAEALANELHAIHGGYARTLLSPAEAAAVSAAVRDVLTRRPR